MWFVTDADLQKVLYVNQAFAERDNSKLSDDELYTIARARESTSRYGWRPYMHNPKLKGRLHRVKVPTLLLWGAEDQIVTPDYRPARLMPRHFRPASSRASPKRATSRTSSSRRISRGTC